jgi:hypothetical protein
VEVLVTEFTRWSGTHIRVALTRGEYRLEHEATSGMTKSAAGSMADKIADWMVQ